MTLLTRENVLECNTDLYSYCASLAGPLAYFRLNLT